LGYEPKWESLKEHSRRFNEEYTPWWFHEVKLGVIIHWGPYSVPGWAPTTGELAKVIEEKGPEYWFKYNPYAEWYYNSMRIPGSPTWEYHRRTYGENFPYEKFGEMLKEEVKKWRPETWTRLFKEAGIRYAVFTTKHHDGFLMWPSDHPNPHREGWQLDRDVVGELARSLRAEGIWFATYYSSGIDWTFNDTVIVDMESFKKAMPRDPEYREYLRNHWYELIDRYRPSILWSDIGYPFEEDLPQLFAYYYNNVEEGLVNDRFTQKHFDFTTPEYKIIEEISKIKWECVRGLGFSFGYNRNEGPEHTLSLEQLVFLLADIISKNGNLLIGVTPMADGTIPQHQVEVLRKLGAWLRVNGEAVYGTLPWEVHRGVAGENIELRFTRSRDGSKLYVFILEKGVRGRSIVLRDLEPAPATSIELLGHGSIEWKRTAKGIEVAIPGEVAEAPAYVLKIEPAPRRS